MPNKTANLELNTWLENEPVDFEEVNANFEKIDKLVSCVESGNKTSNYTGGSESVAKWRYKKYSDGTIEMSTVIYFTNLKSNGGAKAPYYSESSTIYFPFSLNEVYNVQMNLASSSFGWVSNITGKSVLDSVTFRLMSPESESTEVYKQVFIDIKGVI